MIYNNSEMVNVVEKYIRVYIKKLDPEQKYITEKDIFNYIFENYETIMNIARYISFNETNIDNTIWKYLRIPTIEYLQIQL